MENLESNLAQFIGSENIYRHYFGRLFYTDGIRYLAENAGAYWLIDLIASHQPDLMKHKDERLHQMQFWNLKVNADKSAVATCIADSNEPPAVEQKIPFTDFPLPEFDIWVCQGDRGMTAMLRSEY